MGDMMGRKMEGRRAPVTERPVASFKPMPFNLLQKEQSSRLGDAMKSVGANCQRGLTKQAARRSALWATRPTRQRLKE